MRDTSALVYFDKDAGQYLDTSGSNFTTRLVPGAYQALDSNSDANGIASVHLNQGNARISKLFLNDAPTMEKIRSGVDNSGDGVENNGFMEEPIDKAGGVGFRYAESIGSGSSAIEGGGDGGVGDNEDDISETEGDHTISKYVSVENEGELGSLAIGGSGNLSIEKFRKSNSPRSTPSLVDNNGMGIDKEIVKFSLDNKHNIDSLLKRGEQPSKQRKMKVISAKQSPEEAKLESLGKSSPRSYSKPRKRRFKSALEFLMLRNNLRRSDEDENRVRPFHNLQDYKKLDISPHRISNEVDRSSISKEDEVRVSYKPVMLFSDPRRYRIVMRKSMVRQGKDAVLSEDESNDPNETNRKHEHRSSEERESDYGSYSDNADTGHDIEFKPDTTDIHGIGNISDFGPSYLGVDKNEDGNDFKVSDNNNQHKVGELPESGGIIVPLDDISRPFEYQNPTQHTTIDALNSHIPRNILELKDYSALRRNFDNRERNVIDQLNNARRIKNGISPSDVNEHHSELPHTITGGMDTMINKGNEVKIILGEDGDTNKDLIRTYEGGFDHVEHRSTGYANNNPKEIRHRNSLRNMENEKSDSNFNEFTLKEMLVRDLQSNGKINEVYDNLKPLKIPHRENHVQFLERMKLNYNDDEIGEMVKYSTNNDRLNDRINELIDRKKEFSNSDTRHPHNENEYSNHPNIDGSKHNFNKFFHHAEDVPVSNVHVRLDVLNTDKDQFMEHESDLYRDLPQLTRIQPNNIDIPLKDTYNIETSHHGDITKHGDTDSNSFAGESSQEVEFNPGTYSNSPSFNDVKPYNPQIRGETQDLKPNTFQYSDDNDKTILDNVVTEGWGLFDQESKNKHNGKSKVGISLEVDTVDRIGTESESILNTHDYDDIHFNDARDMVNELLNPPGGDNKNELSNFKVKSNYEANDEINEIGIQYAVNDDIVDGGDSIGVGINNNMYVDKDILDDIDTELMNNEYDEYGGEEAIGRNQELENDLYLNDYSSDINLDYDSKYNHQNFYNSTSSPVGFGGFKPSEVDVDVDTPSILGPRLSTPVTHVTSEVNINSTAYFTTPISNDTSKRKTGYYLYHNLNI